MSILRLVLGIIFVIAAIIVVSTYGSQVIYTAAAGAVAAVGFLQRYFRIAELGK